MRPLHRILVLALALLLPTAAAATHIVEVTVGVMGDMTTLTDGELSCSGGSCSLSGPVAGGSGSWMLQSTSLTLDPDPSILAITAVTNTSAVTQTFILNVTLPIAPSFGPPSLIQGSISGSLTDTSSATGLGTIGSATLAAVSGGSIYTALIDGSGVRTLLDDPSSASVVVNNGSTTVGPADFGIPVRESIAVATTTDIGIELRFTLSAGDSASFTSVFDVIPLPEPGVASLVFLGLVALVARGARRL
ncbi:MAG: hypothetical protein ABFS41_09690 [Myxococcota bacterium]